MKRPSVYPSKMKVYPSNRQKETVYPSLQRTELLLGPEAMQQVSTRRVLVVGVGGVGSWCVESLVRSGIRHLTIVDSDEVSVSNINRQLMATTLTVGEPKVEVLRQRLLSINPQAHITAIFGFTLASLVLKDIVQSL